MNVVVVVVVRKVRDEIWVLL